MVFLVFPKEFERGQFLLALDEAFSITYFEGLYGKLSTHDGKRSDVFLVRFGRKTQEPERSGVNTDPSRRREYDETKDQYFAILTCLNSSDVDFTYALMHLIKEIKKHDPSPALILVGTAGGSKYLHASRILTACKFDRGSMISRNKIEINTELEQKETFPGFFQGVTTHCSNWLMHFSMGKDFLDMESFEFSRVCKYMEVIDYACVRICSDLPGVTHTALLETIARSTTYKMDEKKFQCSIEIEKATKQAMILQKLLRKLTDFTNAVNEVLPVLKEYTLKRIRTIPSNNYESGAMKKIQEHMIQRHINEKLLNIYTFPLQDDDYFITSGVTNREVISNIRTIQQKIVDSLVKNFHDIGNEL